ncbi:MAG: hypothetical protein A3G24_11230 [Betaproteobacteria bacterium RIFCSPLOWO2_12_FULL_62_13]|nr:MAG: hypothetical protein A3G24_11230 [Betaproteobacteria bacterium RIFCSPLOWO2_12_FULL_62_13]
MSILPEAAKAYIGVEAETEVACERVERGAARRYAQAIMDEDPIFRDACAENARYGGPVAPPIFPTHMFYWRSFGMPDPVQEHAHDPNFDGTAGLTGGLPDIEPLKHLSVLNGGSEMEFYRYARHGETVKLRARYVDIVEKQTSKGPIILVISESEFLTGDDELLLRARRTQIRR